MLTQSEIAKMLNISRTTVARALNGTGSIHPDTKRRIIELCNELGYEKNPISTSLALKNEKRIFAFIIKTRNAYYTSEIKRGLNLAEKELKMYKYKLNIIETYIDNPLEQVEKLKDILSSNMADGIIITPLLKEEIIKLKRKNTNVIFIALDLSLDKNTISVHSDYYKIGRVVGNIFTNILNYNEKILLIDSEDDRISSKRTFQGVYDKLKEDKKYKIVGPIFQSNLEKNIEYVMKNNLNEDIKAIFSSRFLELIIDYTLKNGYEHLKIISNGFSDKMYKYIEDEIVIAAVIQNYCNIAYMSGKIMFEYLYKGIKPSKKTNEYPCRILLKENLSDAYKKIER